MAGPWAGQILADLGANVIKVERSGVGDDTRTWGPPFLMDKAGKPTKEAGYYLAVNRGKRSIAVNLEEPEGRNVVRAIAERSDILLENFKAGTLAKFGLDYDSLRAINPKLIYCSITGFGQTGPKRDAPAYDFMIQAMGGLMSVTGEADDRPGGGPQKVGVPITDIMTGMYASVAVLAALANREVTGRGDYIDVAMLDVQVAYLANQGMNYLLSGKPPKRSGNAHPNIQPQDVFRCRDGFIALVVGNDAQFKKFCAALDRPNWSDDPRFNTNPNRVRNREVLKAAATEVLDENDLNHWMERFEGAGVPCAPINTIPMVFDDAQVQSRQMLRDLPHPLGGSVPQIVSPMRFANAELEFRRPPPLLGEHTEEILRELGIVEREESSV
jgi:crotonobetainyl-CoA:carnitine CoA-transferase CaiB-like acyl-CoA transferase